MLFLDELTEVPKPILETLRQPLEEREITISRLSGNFRFPASFLFVAAMNSCACGGYPDMNRCTCSAAQLAQYRNRISQPILERIDLCTELAPVSYRQLSRQEGRRVTSGELREQVEAAQRMQKKRYQGSRIQFNSELAASGIEKYCELDERAERMLQEAADHFQLSARVCHNIIKTARTAADLAECEQIKEAHIREAILFRGLDRHSWRA